MFFKPRRNESPTDNARMNSIVDKAVGRSEGATEDGQKELRNRLESFRRLYAFLSQVIPFGDSKLENFDACQDGSSKPRNPAPKSAKIRDRL